jgi:hypothetical protein
VKTLKRQQSVRAFSPCFFYFVIDEGLSFPGLVRCLFYWACLGVSLSPPRALERCAHASRFLLRHQHSHQVCFVSVVVCFLFLEQSCWEVSLWRYIDVVEKGWKQLESRFHQKRTSAALELFNTSLSFREAFSLRFWTRIWSVYSLYDCGYSDQRSYGFYIDIGNGHSMLIPSLLWYVIVTLL